TAEWLKVEATMKQFVASLGGMCVYKPRTVEMVVEMVPVETQIESPSTWKVMEEESGLQPGDIVAATWLKPLGRRTDTQRVAHVSLRLRRAEAANHLKDNHLFHKAQYMKVRKPRYEPKRCAKCQSYDGHFAGACKARADVCARCAGDHRTDNCSMLNSGTFGCSNCKVEGHGAADRSCPAFVQALVKLRARDPSSRYVYYPTADPRTWVLEDGGAAMQTEAR
ncbi:hypothetical protein C8R46DRAFT_826237, partial [Mycena filopes]